MLLQAALVIFSNAASAATDYYYTPQSVGSINGRAVVDATVEKKMYFNLSGVEGAFPQGPITQAISTWNVGDFSGASTPTPFINYQRGLSGYGSTSVAVFDKIQPGGTIEPVFSTMLNAWDFPYNPQIQISGSYLAYWFHENGQDMNLRPFSHGTSSVLRYSSMIQVPTAYVESGGQSQLAMGLTFVDKTTGKWYWFMPSVFVTNAAYIETEAIELDVGTNAYMVGTYVGNGSAYLTLTPSSFSQTSTTWSGWRWFGYSISYAQMQAAIGSLNAKVSAQCPGCTKFSSDPANYIVSLMFVGGEVTRPIAGNLNRRSHIGFSTYGHWLYVSY